ncbi:MAG: hypothetical protein ACTSRI_20350 [Promethearchaeota archaeon]
MSRNKNEHYTLERRSDFKGAFWIIFGIIAFIAVYMPFFAPNLRYQVGSVFSSIFNFIGGSCLFLGVLLFIWGIAGVFCGKSFRPVKIMVLGVLLIWIGMYLMEPTSGFGLSSTGTSKGYH